MLQISYLSWGVIQERIMTRAYGKTDENPGERFNNSQFLVFINRYLRITISTIEGHFVMFLISISKDNNFRICASIIGMDLGAGKRKTP